MTINHNDPNQPPGPLMPLHLAFALGALLLAAAAPPQSPSSSTARQRFEGEVDGWKYALGHEEGVVVENLASRGVSKAMFIQLQPGGVQVANTVSTSGSRGVGRVGTAVITDLVSRTEPLNGYRYSCGCFDANSVRVTIGHHGKMTVLWAYGLNESVKSRATTVIRAWEALEGKMAVPPV